MISRFQIQEMVSQNATRVIFLAEDETTGEKVALRRFFSAGEGVPGVADEDREGFLEAIDTLSQLQHPSLRGVIEGGVDPVDGVPFVATEWVDGIILGDLLENAVLSPADGLKLVRQALSVLEEVQTYSGTKANWLDLRPEDIVVRQTEDGPVFTFWLSLARWLREQEGEEAVVELAALASRCCGFADQSRESEGALGEWLSYVEEKRPGVAEARGALNIIASKDEKPAVQSRLLTGTTAASQAPSPQAVPSLKKKSSATGLVVLAGIVVFLGVVGLVAYLVVQNRPEESEVAVIAPDPEPGQADEEAPAEPPAPELEEAAPDADEPAPPEPEPEPAPVVAKVEAPKKVSSEQDRIAARMNALLDANRKRQARTEFASGEGEELRLLTNKEVTVTGKVDSVRQSSEYLYFEFSEDRSAQDLCIRIRKSDTGGATLPDLKKYVGQELAFKGEVTIYGFNQRISVLLSSLEGVSPVPEN